jgi:hypothetical protein
MEPEQIIEILKYVLLIIVVLIMSLGMVYLIIWMKNKSKQNENSLKTQQEKQSTIKGATTGFDRQSIFNFMEFDTVDDNMIIQKDGSRFLMVIECQGINYDLMSGVEKAGVEEGFVQFLNTLRNPIQLYIQTRTVNLEQSILSYKEKLRRVEEKLNRMKMQYYDMKESGEYTKEQLDKAFFELTKQTNLYEYGRDVINDTERMSLNKNVLNKKYYIIVPFYASELASNDLDKAETKNLAFSEIYTRAQSLISTISACGVRGRILRTNELIELLYMAYNRDEAEVFGLDKAMQAGYNEINTTAPDVLDKKMREIDKYIQEKALEKAREVADEVISEKARKVANKEESMEDLINQMATAILEENERYLGTEITEEAVARIEKKATKEKKGGKKDGEKVTKSTRGRKSTRAI